MIFVFSGPSISHAEVTDLLDCVALPPVSQGDVYRVAKQSPTAICIIDGYFSRVPAVWHKEILWALSTGIPVFGAASMGALRAAELAPFGMLGIGEIYEAFVTGLLEDDDDVAVVHAPSEVDFCPLSEAMVNIRWSLNAAFNDGVVGRKTCSRLLEIAKSTFYPDRSFQRLLADAANEIPKGKLTQLEHWIPEGKINQKKVDAVALLKYVRKFSKGEYNYPDIFSFNFEQTALWQDFTRRAGSYNSGEREIHSLDVPRISADTALAALDSQEMAQARSGALARALTLDIALKRGFNIETDVLEHCVREFRRQRGLTEHADILDWMNENNLSERDFMRLMYEQALIEAVQHAADGEIERNILSHLRVTDQYARLLSRATTN